MPITNLAELEAVADKVYQGAISRPGETILLPDNPLRLTARPRLEPEVVAANLGSDFETIGKMDDTARQRFQLASRWFLRGVAKACLNRGISSCER